MIVDFRSNTVLDFGEGENAFKLHVRKVTVTDLFRVVDALRIGYESAAKVLIGFIVGWDGLTLPGGGHLHVNAQGGDGKATNMADAVIGALDLRMRVNVIAGLLAYIGLKREGESLADLLLAQAEPDANCGSGDKDVDLDPTKRLAAAQPEPSSSAS